MFEHSIKVPRLYKCASKIAKDVGEGRGSIKQLVYESKHRNIKALYALVVNAFQKTNEIEKLLKRSRLLIKEPRFDPWLAKILITELLWGKKRLAGEAKPIKTILAYEQIFKAHLSDVSRDVDDVKQVDKPRYVRINTLKITINEAIEAFRDEGWILKRYTDTTNYLGFLDAVANLDPEEFMIDLHIPYLLIFPPKTQFYQHPAYKKGSIILQDKASCLPVHILNPEPGSTVLDMCAAPGMKTSHCAAVMGNEGKIYGVEIGKKRFETLKKIVESSGSTCVEVINRDVLTLINEHCPNVEYILVDPSCSGSGITDRVEIGQQEREQHHDRLQKLAGFQIKMLRHALTKFPKAKRVVYSTCSVYPEENEDVVRQVLETCRYFKLVSAGRFLQHRWQNFGSSDFGDIGNYCLYAKPDIDLTSGFFVAVFERLEEGESNQFLNSRLLSLGKENKIKKKKSKNGDDESYVTVENKECRDETYANFGKEDYMEAESGYDDGINKSKKKKKRKKKNKESEESDNVNVNLEIDVTDNDSKTKKKIKREIELPLEENSSNKRDKKKKKTEDDNQGKDATSIKKDDGCSNFELEFQEYVTVKSKKKKKNRDVEKNYEEGEEIKKVKKHKKQDKDME